jgi:hypothetical protein
MQQWITSAGSPLVAFLAYDALPALPALAGEGATDPPLGGPRHFLPTRQRRAPLDDQAIPLVTAALPPERTSAPAGARKDAPPSSLSPDCQGFPRPGGPEPAPLATLTLDHTAAPSPTRACGPNVALSRLMAGAAVALMPRARARWFSPAYAPNRIRIARGHATRPCESAALSSG